MLRPDFIHAQSDLLSLSSNSEDIFAKSEPFLSFFSDPPFESKAVVEIYSLKRA
jgi:hypothetical protein